MDSLSPSRIAGLADVEQLFGHAVQEILPDSGMKWAPFEPHDCPMMVFDNKCQTENDPESEARRILFS